MRQIPIKRAADFYQPPPGMRPDAWDQVPAAERVWRWYEIQVHRRVTPPEGILLGASIHARINHSRWVADCVCGSAQVVTPTDPRFACPECGYGWAQLVFPASPEDAEAEVADRLPTERNWWAASDPSWDKRAQPPRDPKAPPERLTKGGGR
ncbi:hypothetical protein [Streptomyces xanthophaeus]|uniref:hypothetical protein n=1 Tax=Streptomyces xanthophaeus TaxID=67385 RepID=UPI003659293B